MMGSSAAISSGGDAASGECLATFVCTFLVPRVRRKVSNHLKPRSKAVIQNTFPLSWHLILQRFLILEEEKRFYSLYYSSQPSAKRYGMCYTHGMNIRIRYFASLREIVGHNEEQLDLPVGA